MLCGQNSEAGIDSSSASGSMLTTRASGSEVQKSACGSPRVCVLPLILTTVGALARAGEPAALHPYHTTRPTIAHRVP